MTYQPKPLNTGNVKIPDDICGLVEQLAKNTHDTWAAQRLAEGWRYGRHRDDFTKEHPCLVPYEDLPESEKEYDRKMAMELLLAIISMGYRIDSGKDFHGRQADFASLAEYDAATEHRVADLSRLDLGKTLELWGVLKQKSEAFPTTVYQVFGGNILRLGEPLLAYDIVVEGLKHWPTDVRLRQLQALALLRSGALQWALDLLEQLKQEGHDDEETLGLLARLHKDLAAQTENIAEKRQWWLVAYKSYLAAYNQTQGYWTGINAATMARLLGETDQALTLAHKVQEQCLAELAQSGGMGDHYWLKATLAEAYLIRKELGGARNWYLQAAKMAGNRYGDLSTTRRNARLLMEAMGLTPHQQHPIEACFRVPRVAIFAGLLIDQPGGLHPRFPPSLEKQIQQKIAGLLKKWDVRIGYASASCCSDLLFLESMLRKKGEVNIILPFILTEFRKTLDLIPGPHWGKRFDQLVNRASRVIVASENRTSGSAVAYEYANLLKDGLATLRAQMLDTELLPIAVWDARAGVSAGGIPSILKHWRSQGKKPELIDISTLLSESPVVIASSGPPAADVLESGPATAPSAKFPQEIRAMLFADVVGYSRLMEEQIPNFITYFIGAIHDLLCEFPQKPLIKNTWGDALYCVFATVRDAGNFSLQLRDRICATDWRKHGLPRHLNLRISLHAGPVFLYKDPLHKVTYYTGVHVSRAARIEPITPVGQVYASQQFAALASSQQVEDFSCDYVGRIPLPKKAGIVPLYLVRRPNHLNDHRGVG